MLKEYLSRFIPHSMVEAIPFPKWWANLTGIVAAAAFTTLLRVTGLDLTVLGLSDDTMQAAVIALGGLAGHWLWPDGDKQVGLEELEVGEEELDLQEDLVG